ncbi:OmpA family protein [Reyranella sp. CPCC 100927]|uniref:OmpA family protein n=1 Tax=Reyranella sp. CPCC 100927 TaxID=2599616 RepID=UPI0011B67FFA|nr:OmpA family protein [Reyranella sp. CPCC 100927]TWT14921.1 OmpA family protein [Reyranella sp. CPCC 100927]
MNRTMAAALAVLAIIGGALALWSAPGTSVGDAAKAELARVSAARDAANTALAAARAEAERTAAAAVAAKAEAERAVAAAREEGERKLMAAQAEANKAIAAAKVEAEAAAAGDRIAALRAEAERAVATARAEAEQTAAALRDQLSQCQAAAAKKPDSESGRCAAAATAPATGPVAAADIGRELDTSGSIALYGIQFDTGSAKLTAESRASIDELAKLMKDDPDLKLLIVGHTDNKGDFTINRNLSEQRAQAVVTDLVTRAGADRTRLSSAGVADLAPLSSNDTDAGRGRNRRVEIVKR